MNFKQKSGKFRLYIYIEESTWIEKKQNFTVDPCYTLTSANPHFVSLLLIILLLLEEQSDKGITCLHFPLHLVEVSFEPRYEKTGLRVF